MACLPICWPRFRPYRGPVYKQVPVIEGLTRRKIAQKASFAITSLRIGVSLGSKLVLSAFGATCSGGEVGLGPQTILRASEMRAHCALL